MTMADGVLSMPQPIADVVRCAGCVQHTCSVAEQAGSASGVLAELAIIADRLNAM